MTALEMVGSLARRGILKKIALAVAGLLRRGPKSALVGPLVRTNGATCPTR